MEKTFTSSTYKSIEEIGQPVCEVALATKCVDVPTVDPGVGLLMLIADEPDVVPPPPLLELTFTVKVWSYSWPESSHDLIAIFLVPVASV